MIAVTMVMYYTLQLLAGAKILEVGDTPKGQSFV